MITFKIRNLVGLKITPLFKMSSRFEYKIEIDFERFQRDMCIQLKFLAMICLEASMTEIVKTHLASMRFFHKVNMECIPAERYIYFNNIFDASTPGSHQFSLFERENKRECLLKHIYTLNIL